ncbi:hypothetical protein GOBAR_DD26777 [Gossypium barbadense]|nr:hypothetical protein GOBAR_DD26777 [Gossypium barbadense]
MEMVLDGRCILVMERISEHGEKATDGGINDGYGLLGKGNNNNNNFQLVIFRMAESGGDNTLNSDRNTKKVLFKGLDTEKSSAMAIDLSPALVVLGEIKCWEEWLEGKVCQDGSAYQPGKTI